MVGKGNHFGTTKKAGSYTEPAAVLLGGCGEPWGTRDLGQRSITHVQSRQQVEEGQERDQLVKGLETKSRSVVLLCL